MIIRILTGSTLGALGLVLIALAIFAIIDPAGTQLADDSNPFGPVSEKDSVWALLIGLIGVGSLALGFRVARRRT